MRTKRRRAGFTLLELMVAMSITLGLGLGLVMLYNRCMDSFSKVEKSLRALQAFRTGADRLEMELNSCVVKAQVFTRANWGDLGPFGSPYIGNWTYIVNAIHGYRYVGITPRHNCTEYGCNGGGGNRATCALGAWAAVEGHSGFGPFPAHVEPGLFGVNFRRHYIGFYSSLDGWRVDRIEYWFNPGEGQIEWNDGIDNDGDDNPDDALNPFHLRVDDRGCLVYRKTPDEDLSMATWDGAAYVPAVCDYSTTPQGPFNLLTAAGGITWPPTGDLDPPRNRDLTNRDQVTADMTEAEIDATIPPVDNVIPTNPLYDDQGIVIGEGFSNIRFYYIYKTNDSRLLKRADWWPWDGDNDPYNVNSNPNLDGAQMPRWQVRGSTDIQNIGGPGQDPRPSDTPSSPPDPSLVDDVDATYLSLPIAVEIVFTSNVSGMENQSFTKLVYLYNSQWLKVLNPDQY